jgi:hypothetical protein
VDGACETVDMRAISLEEVDLSEGCSNGVERQHGARLQRLEEVSYGLFLPGLREDAACVVVTAQQGPWVGLGGGKCVHADTLSFSSLGGSAEISFTWKGILPPPTRFSCSRPPANTTLERAGCKCDGDVCTDAGCKGTAMTALVKVREPRAWSTPTRWTSGFCRARVSNSTQPFGSLATLCCTC